MPNKPTPPNPQDLWQNQTEEEMNLTLVDIRSKALKFQTKIQRRNMREYIGIGVGTIMYGWFLWSLPGLVTKIGAAVTLAGMYFSVYQLYRDGSAQEVPVDSPAGDCLDFHRNELTKQRDMLRRVGPWQIGPVLPGMALFFAGAWIHNVQGTEDAVVMGIAGLLAAGVFAFVYWLNVRAANKLDAELQALAE